MNLLKPFTRPAFAAAVAVATLVTGGLPSPAASMTVEERERLDLSDYTVTDPSASYFDVDARMDILRDTSNPMLLQSVEELETGPSCKQLLELPPMDHEIRIPSFYPYPKRWRQAAQPLFQFEDSVTKLAGSYVASGDPYYAECLVKFLDKWAGRNALMEFHFTNSDPQAWYSTESMIFAAAMSYSIVREQVEGMEDATARVDDWLERLATKHAAIDGSYPSCCNNHFYRRALYGAMVGVLTDNDDLFQFGVSAIHSALTDMMDNGALPLEIERGRRATHYQNYALLYLIPIMQIVERQGYDVFEMTLDGKSIHDAVRFAMSILNDPANLGDLAPLDQYKGFLVDDQYFAWMEIYLSRFENAAMSQFLRTRRPVYNRSAGGYATLYFMDPDAQVQVVQREKATKDLVLDEEQQMN